MKISAFTLLFVLGVATADVKTSKISLLNSQGVHSKLPDIRVFPRRSTTISLDSLEDEADEADEVDDRGYTEPYLDDEKNEGYAYGSFYSDDGTQERHDDDLADDDGFGRSDGDVAADDKVETGSDNENDEYSDPWDDDVSAVDDYDWEERYKGTTDDDFAEYYGIVDDYETDDFTNNPNDSNGDEFDRRKDDDVTGYEGGDDIKDEDDINTKNFGLTDDDDDDQKSDYLNVKTRKNGGGVDDDSYDDRSRAQSRRKKAHRGSADGSDFGDMPVWEYTFIVFSAGISLCAASAVIISMCLRTIGGVAGLPGTSADSHHFKLLSTNEDVEGEDEGSNAIELVPEGFGANSRRHGVMV